ncbi:MAG: recombinase family protein, partial [Pseudomonadota bacterium]
MKAAIYTRYSTSMQREASSEDQARNARRRIDAEGWELLAHYKDEGISGSTTERPGYQAMLAAAEGRQFDVLVVDDLSRLSRDQVESERMIRRLEFRGIRIIATSDGYDSQSKSRKVQRGVRGLMNELYVDDLRDKTHRGMTGQAMKKFWAGGKPYGYRLLQLKDDTRQDTYGNPMVIGTQLVVDPEQAQVVRDIFEMYANDLSHRAIAAQLNERAVASPGSYWRNRKVRRASGWLGSTINELVANPLYLGRLVWNKTQWIKDPDKQRRTTRARPKSDWISHDMPELRIIDDALWQRVLARRERAAVRGAMISAKCSRIDNTGRGGPKYAFSGLLRCGVCASSMVIVGGTKGWRAYGCSGHKDGGPAVCSNAISVRQTLLEARLVAPLKTDLLTPQLEADVERAVVRKLVDRSKAPDHAPRLAALRGEISNLADAMATGALKNSPALGQRLQSAETEFARLTALDARPLARVVDFPARLRARFHDLVASVEYYLQRDPHRARAAMRQICGEIELFPHESGKFLVARLGLSAALLKAAGGTE